MKLSSAFLALGLSLFAFTPLAHASTIPAGGNLGALSAGMGDTFDVSSLLSVGQGVSLTGLLDPNTKLTFTFDLGNGSLQTFEVVGGAYSYASGGDLYAGGASSSSVWAYNAGTNTWGSFDSANNASTINGLPSETLILASSHLDSAASGNATLTNTSAIASVFNFTLYGIFAQGQSLLTYSVSEVPLPAALPLFGLGLAGIAGLRARKRRAAA